MITEAIELTNIILNKPSQRPRLESVQYVDLVASKIISNGLEIIKIIGTDRIFNPALLIYYVRSYLKYIKIYMDIISLSFISGSNSTGILTQTVIQTMKEINIDKLMNLLTAFNMEYDTVQADTISRLQLLHQQKYEGCHSLEDISNKYDSLIGF